MVEELRQITQKVNEIPYLREHTLTLIQLVRSLKEEIKKVSDNNSAETDGGDHLSKIPILKNLKEIENKASLGLFNFLQKPSLSIKQSIND